MTVRARMWLTHPAAVLVEFAVLAGLWEVYVGLLGLVNPVFLPPPSAIAKSFVDLASSGTLADNLIFSLGNLAAGLGFASVAGIALGVIMGSYLPVDRLVGPIAWMLYSAPLIAIRPMTVVWFGFGSAPIIFLVFLSAFFPILFNTATGVRTVNASLLRAGMVFGANELHLAYKVRLPWALPYVMAGFRIAIPAGVIGLLVSELVGSGRGIGAIITAASNGFNTSQAFAALAVITAGSVLLVSAVTWIERGARAVVHARSGHGT